MPNIRPICRSAHDLRHSVAGAGAQGVAVDDRQDRHILAPCAFDNAFIESFNKGWLERFWDEVRAEAGLRGVRLHDLRHTHASIALRQGETVLTIARLLGHRNPETTLKYTHLADRTVMDAAERVGAALGA